MRALRRTPQPWSWRPLEKVHGDGIPYHREAVVDRQIRQLCAFPVWRRDKELRLRGPLQTFKAETLVFAAREAIRCGDDELAWHIAQTIAETLASHIARTVRRSGVPERDVDDVVADVFMRFYTAIREPGSAQDFMEVRVWFVLAQKARSEARKWMRDNGLDRVESDTRDSDGVETAITRLVDSVDLQDLVVIRDLADRMGRKYGKLWRLLTETDLKIESNDPTEPTISRELGVTPRTVRNWIRKLKDDLEGELHG